MSAAHARLAMSDDTARPALLHTNADARAPALFMRVYTVKVLVYLTMPLEPESSNLAEQRSYLQSFKAPLLEGECLGIIVSVVMEPLSAHPDMGEEDAQTVQLVLTLFRNLLRITDAVATAASGSHHKTRMRELMIQRFFDENVMELHLSSPPTP